MFRIMVAASLTLLATAACSTTRSTRLEVAGSDPNAHYIEEFQTVLSYEANSVVAISGQRTGGDLLLTVAVRNASNLPVELAPENILVVAGDDPAEARALTTYRPAAYLERHVAAHRSRLSLQAHEVEWDAAQAARTPTETASLSGASLETAGSFLRPTDAPPVWASVSRRNAEIREQAEAYATWLESLSRDLLWPTVLQPGQYTYGKVAIADESESPTYRVVVPVGKDLHEFTLAVSAS